MPPTTTSKALEGTDVIAKYNPQLASDVRRTLTQPSGFKVDIPETIPSTTLQGNTTVNDVLARRNEMEAEKAQRDQLTTDYGNLTTRIGSVSPAFANPEQFLSRLLLNRPTDTQTKLDLTRADQAANTRNFAENYASQRGQARTDFNVSGLTDQLTQTRTQIAERQKKLREDLRAFETNAKERGVARPFYESERQKLQTDAAAELADLSIIESAQTGNLQLANQQVDDVLAELRQGFEFENQAIEQEIARLSAIDTREADQRKEQLQIALDERNRQIDQKLADEKEKRSYMVEAATNGADQGTLDAIRNAATPGEAALLAGPWLATQSGGGSSGVSSATQAVIENPSLFDNLTPTLRGQVISELQANGYNTSNLGTKPLSDTAISQIADAQKALDDLDTLRTTIEGHEQFLGPITGLQRFNPYSEAKKVQADVDRVRQTVGKALEGGVLRKEDEDKYKQILATLADTPETAIYKIDALKSSIQRNIEEYKVLQQQGGRSLDVGAKLPKKGTQSETSPEDLRAKYNY